jgi:hypothetical protein
MLTKTQLEARDGKLTASRIACLMTGNETEIMKLWREMIGDPDFEPEDLSNVWPIQLGLETEALNLRWYTRKSGRDLSRFGEVVCNPKHNWAACTLDAWDTLLGCPVECKHVGGHEPLSMVTKRYQPQMHWQMIVTGARKVMFSVIEGANEPVVDEIPFDESYARELWTRALSFMLCVNTLTPPCIPQPAPAPVDPTKSYDYNGHNEWASNAALWLETREAAKKFKTAESSLKQLVPADAKRVHGHGIEINRNRAGSLSLKAA